LNSIIFRDVLLSMLLGMVALVLLANFDPQSDKDLVTPPGNLIVSITWKPGNDDVDLWLTAPGEPKSVGYSNKDGKIWNLLRDDTGFQGVNQIDINYENAFSRGMPDGEYIVNIHGYRISAPLTVNFELALNQGGGAAMQILVSQSILLDEPGKELTAIRFTMKDGKVVPDSISQIFQPVRTPGT